jgi:hypothetical protein
MDHEPSGCWPGIWPAEDGGPARRQVPRTDAAIAGFTPGAVPTVVHREVPMATMVVSREQGELFLLRHTPGPDAVAWVERIDPGTLEPLGRSAELPGGPMWPGGLAAHADGSLHVVFGDHAHRLSAGLELLASAELPRKRPYNSFVVLGDGHLVAKDFGGQLPPGAGGDPVAPDCEILVLDPVSLSVVARAVVPEPSVARLSAAGSTVYVVGVEHLWRLGWDGRVLELDHGFSPRYRSIPGQSHGWDCVLTGAAPAGPGLAGEGGSEGSGVGCAAWFLDDGAGSERYAGTFRGMGISEAPLHLVRVDLRSGEVELSEVCGRPRGLVANPPLVDERRRIAVAFDSSNSVMTAFDLDGSGVVGRRWQRDQCHGSHMVLLEGAGQVVTADHDGDRMMEQLVVLDITTGEEVCRTDTGSPLQSVLFPALDVDGPAGAVLYLVSFSTLTRVAIG